MRAAAVPALLPSPASAKASQRGDPLLGIARDTRKSYQVSG